MDTSIAALVRDLIAALKADNKNETAPFDTTGTVKRIETNTAWVVLAGGARETPVSMTIACNPGDTVQVRVSGGRAWITGNQTAPPTDDTTAIVSYKAAKEAGGKAESALTATEEAIKDAAKAHEAAESAQQSANNAQTSANNAQTSANNAQTSANNAQTSANNAAEYASRALGNLSTVQSVAETLAWITQHGTMTLTADTEPVASHIYFVQDVNGDYTVNNIKYSIVTEPDPDNMSSYYELSIDQSLNNYVGTHLALTGEGLWLLPAGSGAYKILIATGAGSTYTVAGIYIIDGSSDVVSKFLSTRAQVGKDTGGHSVVDENGMKVYGGSSGNTLLAILGYGEAAYSDRNIAPYYTLGTRHDVISISTYDSSATYEEGDLCKYNGTNYICTTPIETPEAWNSGHWSKYLIGGYSTAEGEANVAAGTDSHAEGIFCKTTGRAAHAEGYGTLATADAHSEGRDTKAFGHNSHASGFMTIAQRASQTVIGEYNIPDTGSETPSSTERTKRQYRGDYVFIIGNGEYFPARTRSNALTVDWSGNVACAGTLTQGSDRRLKDHIGYIAEEAIEFVRSLKPAHYIKDGKHHVGFYAQDVEKADKWECMVGEMNGYKTLGYTELIAPLVAYCQKLEERIEELERRTNGAE